MPSYTERGGSAKASGLLAENQRQPYEGLRAIAARPSEKPGFATGFDVHKAADLLYPLASEDHYGLLVVERGWTPEAWQQWSA